MLVLTITAPAQARSNELDRARVITLVKQVWAAGTWDQQRAAFERLPEPERSAVWAALVDVRRAPVRSEGPVGRSAPVGACDAQQPDACDWAVAPRPDPRVKPGTNPSSPPILTTPTPTCKTDVGYAAYEVLGEPGVYAFVYAAPLHWCWKAASVTGPLTQYSSYSYAFECCKFPWNTDPSKYIDVLTPVPASNTQTIIDHHTGYFYATGKVAVAGVELDGNHTNTPNIDATVLGDGTYVVG